MYGRRNYKKKSRRAPYRRRAGAVARRKLTFKRRVLRIVGAESKFRLMGFTEQPFVGDQEQFLVTNIPRGTTQSTRIGNWIRPTSLRGEMVCIGDGASTTALTFSYRLGVALWKNDESVDPFSAARIMQDPAAPLGPFDVIEKGAYQVLWTRTGTVVNNSDNSQITKKYRFNVNLSKLPRTLFDDTAQKKYSIHFFFLSDDIVGSAPLEVAVDAMLRYTDS